MSRSSIAFACALFFVAGGLVSLALAPDPLPQKVQTGVHITQPGSREGVIYHTFEGFGTHWLPEVNGVRVGLTTVQIDAPEEIPESKPFEAGEAIEWAFFTLLALFCVVVATFIVWMIVGFVLVTWLETNKQ